MTFLAGKFRGVLCLFSVLLLAGCFHSGSERLDEEKDPYYLTGKNRTLSLDYQGAKESFTKCLEMNPRHSLANFELGLIFERETTNSARAIYHYEEYLRLRPKAENADVVQQKIMGCKQELARSVSLAPVTQQMQRNMDNLSKENVLLKHQIEELQTELAKRPVFPIATQAQVVPPVSAPVPANRNVSRSGTLEARANVGSATRVTPQPVAPPPPTNSARTHTVKSGETPAAIARQYSVSLNALMAANPGLDARRMRVGQALNIPSH